MKRKATSALCSPKDQDYESGSEAAPTSSAKKKSKAASVAAPINRRKQPAKKSSSKQTAQLQHEHQQQDGPVWIYGLINNIEQMLTQFNNKQRMQQVVQHQQQQQQQQGAASFQTQTIINSNKTGQQGKTSSKTKSRSSARSSGYSTPSSLYSSASLSPPFSSPSSSSSSACAYGSSSSSNSPVAACSFAPSRNKKSCPELLATNNNQLPRSPISRQIKFHEYKGPPQARKASNKQQQQQQQTTDCKSSEVGSVAGGHAPKQLAAPALEGDGAASKQSGWQNGNLPAAISAQRRPSQLFGPQVNPSHLNAVQVREINVATTQMTSLQANNLSSQILSAQHQYQPPGATQLTQNHHPHGPILMAPSNMQQQQQRPQIQSQQNYQQIIQSRQQQLLAGSCQQRHQAQGQQHQIIQMPVSCQLIQQHQLRQQQHQQQRRIFANQPVSIQVLRDGNQNYVSNQQQVFVVDQAAFHQIQLQQQQQQQQQQRAKSVTVVLQQQQQQQFHNNQQQQHQLPSGSLVRYSDVNNNCNQFPNQQFDHPYAPQQQQQQEVHPALIKAEFGATDVKDSESSMGTSNEHYEQRAQSGQPAGDDYQEKFAVPESSYNSAPFGDLAQSTDCEYQNTCDDLEPTISFESDLADGTSSGSQPFDDALLFSEFIDFQDIPLNVDESDWLRKFLPPCSTL